MQLSDQIQLGALVVGAGVGAWAIYQEVNGGRRMERLASALGAAPENTEQHIVLRRLFDDLAFAYGLSRLAPPAPKRRNWALAIIGLGLLIEVFWFNRALDLNAPQAGTLILYFVGLVFVFGGTALAASRHYDRSKWIKEERARVELQASARRASARQ